MAADEPVDAYPRQKHRIYLVLATSAAIAIFLFQWFRVEWGLDSVAWMFRFPLYVIMVLAAILIGTLVGVFLPRWKNYLKWEKRILAFILIVLCPVGYFAGPVIKTMQYKSYARQMPVVPDSEVVSTKLLIYGGGDGFRGVVMRLDSDASREAIHGFYESKMPGLGWRKNWEFWRDLKNDGWNETVSSGTWDKNARDSMWLKGDESFLVRIFPAHDPLQLGYDYYLEYSPD